jgi:glycosyltransferase involved in cell wall biosynthesis
LTAADLVALPLADGASGRRSSVVTALAAGAPVLSTAGDDTDEALFPASSIRLAPAGDGEAFAAAAVDLARDAEARIALGREGRALYEREFSWQGIARTWSAILRAAARSSPLSVP